MGFYSEIGDDAVLLEKPMLEAKLHEATFQSRQTAGLPGIKLSRLDSSSSPCDLGQVTSQHWAAEQIFISQMRPIKGRELPGVMGINELIF